MPSGLQSFRVPQGPLKERNEQGILEGFDEYRDLTIPSFPDLNQLQAIGKPIAPPPNPYTQSGPWSIDPFTPGMDVNLPDYPRPTLEQRVIDLNLDSPENPVTEFIANELQDDNKGEDEKRAAIKAGVLNDALGPLDFTNPSIKGWFLDEWGIDLDQRQKDYEARKEGGMPFINAGLALSQASRAGLNVPQALASAFAAFSATKDKLNELDPLMLKLALATLPKTAGGLTMKGFNAISGPLSLKNSGEWMGTDEEALNYRSGYGDQSVLLSSQVSDDQKNRKSYYVPITKPDGTIVLDVQSLTDTQHDAKVKELQVSGAFTTDKSTLDIYQPSARTQRLSVWDNDLKTETVVTEAEFLEDQITASLVKDGKRQYRAVGGVAFPVQNVNTGETGFFSAATMNDKAIQDAGWVTIQDQGSILYDADGNMIQSTGNVGDKIAQDRIQGFKDEIVERGETSNKMARTLEQIDELGQILKIGGDVAGGRLARGFYQFKDVILGGGKEVINALGIDPRTRFVIWDEAANRYEDSSLEEHRRNFLNKLNNNSNYLAIKRDVTNRYSSDQARRQAANALGGAFYSMALQVAMGPYNMTARSISDKDMDRTLHLIGASAPSFEAAMLNLTSELDRSMVTANENWAQSRLLRSLDATIFVDDPDDPGTKIKKRESILVINGEYIPDPENPGRYILADKYTNNPAVAMGATQRLKEINNELRDKYTALGGTTDPGNTRLFNLGINMDKTLNALQTNTEYDLGKAGIITYQSSMLDKKFNNQIEALDGSTLGGVAIKSGLQNAGLAQTADLRTLLKVFHSVIMPKMNESNSDAIEKAFFEAFGMTTKEEQNLFTKYLALTQRHGIK